MSAYQSVFGVYIVRHKDLVFLAFSEQLADHAEPLRVGRHVSVRVELVERHLYAE